MPFEPQAERNLLQFERSEFSVTFKVFGGVFGDAEVRGNELISFGRADFEGVRFCFFICAWRLGGASHNFRQFLAHKSSIYQQRQANHEWYHSSNPKTAEDCTSVRGNVPAYDETLHENVEKNRNSETSAAGDDASLYLVVTPDFRCDAAPMVQFVLTPLALGGVNRHFRKPRFVAPKWLVRSPSIDNLSYGMQIGPARLAEFQLIALCRTAAWAKHMHAPVEVSAIDTTITS